MEWHGAGVGQVPQVLRQLSAVSRWRLHLYQITRSPVSSVVSHYTITSEHYSYTISCNHELIWVINKRTQTTCQWTICRWIWVSAASLWNRLITRVISDYPIACAYDVSTASWYKEPIQTIYACSGARCRCYRWCNGRWRWSQNQWRHPWTLGVVGEALGFVVGQVPQVTWQFSSALRWTLNLYGMTWSRSWTSSTSSLTIVCSFKMNITSIWNN